LTKQCREHGYKATILECPLYIMEVMTQKLDDEYLTKSSKGGVNNITLPVLRKRCYEKLLNDGLKNYLEQQVEKVDELVEIVKYFKRKPWSKKTNSKLVEEIFEIFETSSLMMFMENLPIDLLDDICDYMMLDIKGTSSRRSIVDCIIYGCHSATDDSSEEKVVKLQLSDKKPKSINAECTRDDLIYFFTTNDLKKFLSDHKLISSGKKNMMVNRVIEYYEDKEKATERYGVSERKDRRKQKTEKKKQTREKNLLKMEEKKRDRSQNGSQSQDIDDKHDKSPVDQFEDLDGYDSNHSSEDKENEVERSKEKIKHERESSKNNKSGGRNTRGKRKQDNDSIDEISEKVFGTKINDD